MANDIDNPRRNQVAHYNGPSLAPRHVPNNPIDRVLTRFDARGKTATLNALTEQAEAGTRYVNALTAGTRSLMAYLEVQAEIADLPAKIAHRAAVSLEYRKAEFEEAVHQRKLAHLRHEHQEMMAEAQYVDARATLTRARTGLVDAEQQLDAQRKHGALHYELAHAEQNLKRLDIQLSEEERRALLRRQLRQIEDGESEAERVFRDRLAQLSETDDSTTED